MQWERVKELIDVWGPAAVGVGSTLDNTGVPIFLVAGLTIAALAQQAGTAGALTTPEAMAVAALAGSIVGDLGVYAIGRYFLTKDRIVAGGFGSTMKPVLDAGERSMQRWGMLALIFGRFVPYVGKVTPFLAGSYRMSWWRAAVSVIVGSVLLIGLFYSFTATVVSLIQKPQSQTIVKNVSVAIGAAAIIGMWYLNSVLKRKQATNAPSEPAGEIRASRYHDRSEAE